MKLQIFSENDWVYPDSEITELSGSVCLDTARNANISFQVLTNLQVDDDTPISIEWSGEDVEGLTLIPYQLIPVRVEENSDVKLFTTLDYDSVKDFVTRQAPFYVYDVTRDIDDGMLKKGRAAFYFRINVSSQLEPGEYESVLKLVFNGCEGKINIKLRVYKAVVPSLENCRFSMVNWLFLDHVSKAHNLEYGSEKFWDVIGHYMDNQLDMRSNHLMLSSGKPILDENGNVVDFDFSEMIKEGKMAIDKGFTYIYGGFVSHWKKWDATELYLLWNMDIEVTSLEAYRQLKIYFTKLWSIILENGWENKYMQCLVDEPNFPNSGHYRILSGICRKCMPGVIINDPVESTELGGAVDIWVVKQSLYEQYKAEYEFLQELGEEIWIYTCGYPAGKMMNRVIDLSLMASRLPMWMCYKYNAPGFLHWGYNALNDEPFENTCFYRGNPEKLLPPGNSNIVYPGNDKPWYSIRGHLQRAGAEDYELLYQLGLRDRNKADEIIARVCTTFDEYNPSAENFNEVRRTLLETLDELL
ncbi:MAG TPA: DUF4091 domain-containing protein [Clostridiaceae bacterium]|jgi:hypothetical protein|nr:DUF4091 domain-containing protein [Clostridiaceae bacterium]